jgi:iron-sulfur cluster repair protein YtfE (RIC family)
MAQASMDAISLLEEDHAKVKQLFGQVERSGTMAGEGSQTGGMQERGGQMHHLFQQIARELEIHTKIEEEIFYPAARAVDQNMIDEAIQEHHQVDELISRIRAMQSTDTQFASLMQELMQSVQHHVQEEEAELFPKVRQSMGGQLGDLGRRMYQRKQGLMGQMAA